MSKVLIVTGGSVNVAWAKEWLDNQIFDYCIAADSGLEYADKLGLKVDFLLGNIGIHGSYAANHAVSECDLLISIGTRFNDRITGKISEFAKDAKIVHIDIPVS